MGLLEVSLVGVSYATSRWTLTTTLFRAIKRINLSRGSRTCFYIYKRRLAIFTHFKTLDITRVSCVIYFLCLLYYCFYLLFFWRFNSCKNLEDKDILKRYSDISSSRGFLYNSVTWRFLLMYFLFKVSASFLIFNSCVCLLYCSSWRLIGFVLSFISWLLDSILWVFS
jgi:hypothetical protein